MADTYDVMKEVARNVIREELSIRATESFGGRIEVQLQLGGQNIGDPYYIEVDTDSDHRHGCDHVTSVWLEVE